MSAFPPRDPFYYRLLTLSGAVAVVLGPSGLLSASERVYNSDGLPFRFTLNTGSDYAEGRSCGWPRFDIFTRRRGPYTKLDGSLDQGRKCGADHL